MRGHLYASCRSAFHRRVDVLFQGGEGQAGRPRLFDSGLPRTLTRTAMNEYLVPHVWGVYVRKVALVEGDGM